MKDVDIKRFEKRIKLRTLTTQEYEAVVELQQKCFPGMKTWTRDQYDSLTNIFPEGQLCIMLNKKVIASCCSLIVDFDEYHETHTWRDITGQGYATTHDVHGDTLYGIEIIKDINTGVKTYTPVKYLNRTFLEKMYLLPIETNEILKTNSTLTQTTGW